MNADKQTEKLFTAEETSHNDNDDTLASDDNLEVEFGDPTLMGDRFDWVVETGLSHFNHDRFIDWMAAQLRFASQREAAAEKLLQRAAKLRQSLYELRDLLPQSHSQTSHSTTHK